MKTLKTFQVYPSELEDREAEAIEWRRRVVDRKAASPPVPSAPPVGEAAIVAALRKLPADTLAVALSGGGVRSATFCLGFLQAMAKRGILRHVDILSTVSGGGYVGAFLGRFYDRLRDRPDIAPDMVERAVANPASGPLRWLRDHGNYIAPAGRSDLTVALGIALRNVATVQLLLAILAFAAFGFANALRYGALDPANSLLPYFGVSWSDLPLGRLVAAAGLKVFWSPWVILAELVLLLGALPNGLGYWLASQDEPESYNRPSLLVAFLLIIALLLGGVVNGLRLQLVLAAVPILLAFVAVEWAWRNVRRDNASLGTSGPRIEQLRARNHLSRDLGMWLAVAGVLLYFATVDTIGRAVYEAYTRENPAFLKGLSRLGAVVVALYPVLRGAGWKIADARSDRRRPGRLAQLAALPAVSGLLAVLLMAPPLVLVSYCAHAAFGGGGRGSQRLGLLLSGGALLLSLILAVRWAIHVINRSSLQAIYAARLARAFLGASNPNLHGARGDDVRPGDDVESLPRYRPFEAGGPLHLISVCVNQTVDVETLRSFRARQGTILACSPVGLSVGEWAHALWVDEGKRGGRDQKPRPGAGAEGPIRVVANAPGVPHPLLGVDGKPPEKLDVLPLRDWVSISGAAFGPGMGGNTNAALSVLFTLANLRTGYWWDSGLTSGDRGTRPRVSFVRRLMWLVPNLFQTQSRLVHEALARFRGPWDRFWYLSDGGHFENLGGYELIRRKVPFMILIDAGADPGYDFADFASFQRKVRLDFGAEIEPLGDERWGALVAAAGADDAAAKALQTVTSHVTSHVAVSSGGGGPLDALLASSNTGRQGYTVGKHAALFEVSYGDGRGRKSLLLYVKASLSGDEPPDVQNYRLANPDFPHQSTADQSFDEAQWESYRRLGEHIGDRVLGPIVRPDQSTDKLWLTRLGSKSNKEPQGVA